jgi:hypothetical protein
MRIVAPAEGAEVDALEARFGIRVAAALNALQAAKPDRDADERLRFAREQALARARDTRRPAEAPGVVGRSAGAAVLAGPTRDDAPWWLRLSSLLPLAVLLAGLLLIDHQYTRAQIEAAAEVDAALLADDLPPEAYRDPGFVEFLKASRP